MTGAGAICPSHNVEKVTATRPDGRKRFVCRQCAAERLRRWYQLGRRPRKPEDPTKKQARKAVENALTRGVITRRPCERCGAAKTHAHHEDYLKPLDVTWLCPLHHKARHREILDEKKAARLLGRAA